MRSKIRGLDDINRKIKKIDNIQLIRELNNKQLTSDDLNLLGDLCLKKGDKKRAIECFYGAAAKISFSNTNRTIAIYKKILNISPSEITAYEGIISILSKSGLDAEQKKYLLSLAQLYQNTGDFKKANSIFRKVQELDPTNKAAEFFFSRGKVNTKKNNPQ
jgi:tetratricopeptide (TPR) repeat protein